MPIAFPHKPGIVAYLTAGDPSLDITYDIALAAIDNGADVIELGVPFSDPLADGPVIQRASERAVARGVTLEDVLALAKKIRQARPACGLVLFSYLNPVVRFGKPQSRLRETIQASAAAKGTYSRQTGGYGNFAEVELVVRPRLEGFGYVSELPPGTLPGEYLAAIEEGVRTAVRGGVLESYPLTNLDVTLLAATQHPTHSNAMSFTIAASMALKEAARKARPVVLKPEMSMQIFCRAAKAAGADGVLLTDMIVEEAGEYLAAMSANELAPIFLAAPTSPDARLRAIADVSKGFVYAISRVGITGTRDEIASDAPTLVARLRAFTQLPIAVGFGISNATHVAAVADYADAAIIGSALVALIEQSKPEEAAAAVGQFIAKLR